MQTDVNLITTDRLSAELENLNSTVQVRTCQLSARYGLFRFIINSESRNRMYFV